MIEGYCKPIRSYILHIDSKSKMKDIFFYNPSFSVRWLFRSADLSWRYFRKPLVRLYYILYTRHISIELLDIPYISRPCRTNVRAKVGKSKQIVLCYLPKDILQVKRRRSNRNNKDREDVVQRKKRYQNATRLDPEYI